MKDIRYPQVLDINGNLVAILNRAYKIGYDKVKNGLWTASFTMPLNDAKLDYVLPKYHIEIFDHDKRIGRFIVNPKRTIKNESTREVSFECEHVLSLLHSDILFRYHQYTNLIADSVIEGLLSMQEVKHWQLGSVEMSRYFSYAWENEDSLLNAIMSITQPFDIPYLWTWDDSTYPFSLHLKNPSDEVKDVIVSGKNLKGIELEEDPINIVTRIYPLGFGEGVNQLTIEKVNGFPYLDDPNAEQLYGIHKRVWIDKRVEDANTLMANAQAILNKFNKPVTTCSISAIDYYLKDKYNFDAYTTGDMLQVFDLDTSTNKQLRVEKLSKSDIYGQPDAISLELGNRVADIGMTWSDIQKKQLVNDTYSQGATNIDSRDFSDNCDSAYPAVIRFPIPDDVVNINEMLLTFETTKYRAYSKAIKGGGGSTATSTSGGGSTATSTSGGGSTQSSNESGDHKHAMFSATGFIEDPNPASNVALSCNNGLVIYAGSETGAGIQYFTEGSSGTHSHSVTIPSHSHNVTIPAHSHDVTVPEHTHGIDYGIFEFATLPTAVQITVDGTVLSLTATSGDNIDLLPYLQKDGDGNISRGRYAEIKLAPNNLARINATVSSRLFIQSRIGTVM